MRILKNDIKEELLGLNIRGSREAGKLRGWIVDNMQRLFPGRELEVEDFNFEDTDHTRVYVASVVEYVPVEIQKPIWSFFGFTSKRTVPKNITRRNVLLSVQLGTVDSWESTTVPIVTSESGLYVN